MKARIRPLTLEDLSCYRKLRLEALKTSPTAFGSDYESWHDKPLEDFAKHISNPGNIIMGAFQDGELLGMIGFHRMPRIKQRHKGTIFGVYVTPKKRGQGLSRLILTKILEQLRTVDGLEMLLLGVEAENIPAKSLYSSFGFEVYGREPKSIKVDGQFHAEDLMVLHLPD